MGVHFHHVPGRIRVHVPRMKGCGARARDIETHLGKLEGVIRVESRELTGSVIVNYDPKLLDARLLWSRLHESGAVTQVPAQPAAGNHSRLAVKAARAVAWYAFEKALERSIPLIFGAML